MKMKQQALTSGDNKMATNYKWVNKKAISAVKN